MKGYRGFGFSCPDCALYMASNHMHEYSIGRSDSHMPYAIRIHARLHISNTISM